MAPGGNRGHQDSGLARERANRQSTRHERAPAHSTLAEVSARTARDTVFPSVSRDERVALALSNPRHQKRRHGDDAHVRGDTPERRGACNDRAILPLTLRQSEGTETSWPRD